MNTFRAKDCHQWTQADPLTTKRVASIKKLAYYVQNQLEQAQKALDYKWNEALRRDPHFNKLVLLNRYTVLNCYF